MRLSQLLKYVLWQKERVYLFPSPALTSPMGDSSSSRMYKSEFYSVTILAALFLGQDSYFYDIMCVIMILPHLAACSSGMSHQPIKLNRKDEPQVVELECYSKMRGVEGQSRCKAFYIHVSIPCLYLQTLTKSSNAQFVHMLTG